MASLSPKPTDWELAILQVLWKDGPATVKQVHERIGTEAGYTTVLKFLQIMTEKRLVTRDETARAHVYRAAHTEQATQQQLVSRLVKKAFRGSTAQLVMRALTAQRATPTELAEIRLLIDTLAKEAK
jgi:predicted transcriptional regulator